MEDDFKKLNEVIESCLVVRNSLVSAADNYLRLLGEEKEAKKRANSGDLEMFTQGNEDLEKISLAKDRNDAMAHELVIKVFQENLCLIDAYYSNFYKRKIDPSLEPVYLYSD